MKNITVIGAGTMGNGIAHTFAQNGYNVVLSDVSEAALKKAIDTISFNLDRQIKKGVISESKKTEILSRITTDTSLKHACKKAELIIEAATEKPEIKLGIFKDLDQYAPQYCILASNTSSISITQIANVTKRPESVIGMHFMNPVPIMKLVEVIKGKETSDDTCRIISKISKSLEKIPVQVNDYPGFIANRILMPMINEAIYALHENVAGVEEIDTIMKLGMSHPMGPLQLADHIGLDVCLAILKVLHKEFNNPKYTPCPLLEEMVTLGHQGAKSGIGFYNHSKGSTQVADRFLKK